MKNKSMALLLIVVSSFMMFLSPLSSVPATLAQQERSREQGVESPSNQTEQLMVEPVEGSPCGRPTGVLPAGQEASKRFGQDDVQAHTLSSNPVIIKVYFHVINQGSGLANGDVPENVLDNQIAVLNNSFSGTTGLGVGGAETPFRFVKGCVTRTTNSTWFNMPTPRFGPSNAEIAAKSALHWGGATDLNFYTINGGGSAWARFPCEYQADPELDGIVVPYTMLPGGSRANFNQGDIAVHEVGHWLGLFHTYAAADVDPEDAAALCSEASVPGTVEDCPSNAIASDGVDDTPAHFQPSSVVGTCPTNRDSCPQPGLDPDNNFMTDTSDTCKRKFTPGQSDRMVGQYVRYRQDHASTLPDPTASIAWIMPSENSWGPPNTMTVGGYAQNGCGPVQLFWRDATQGGSFRTVQLQVNPDPVTHTWFNTIPSPYKCHNFQAYVKYSGIQSGTFSYNGLNSGFCNESVNLIWIQPAHTGTSGNLRVAGKALNAPAGTKVFVWYRNVSTGGNWVRHPTGADQMPDGIWLLDIPNANFFHVYQVQAEYDVKLSGICTYQGNNTIWWCQ